MRSRLSGIDFAPQVGNNALHVGDLVAQLLGAGDVAIENVLGVGGGLQQQFLDRVEFSADGVDLVLDAAQ